MSKLPPHIAFTQSLATDIRASLSDSTGQSMTVGQLLRLTNTALEDLPLRYAPIQGEAQLRAAIVDFHQSLNSHKNFLSKDDAITFCGAQEALLAIYQSLLMPGDEVVVVTPCYPSLLSMAKKLGAKIREIKLSPENGWQVNIEDFHALINDKTRLVVLNSPHNPSGSIIDSILAEQILTLVRKYNSFLLSDDVSQASNYQQLPLAHKHLEYENSVVVGVMSKSFGLAGMRVGWAVSANKELMKKLIAFKASTSICCSAIDEQLALVALRHANTIIDNNNQIVVRNITLFNKLVARNPHKLAWYPPKAGMLALVEIHQTDTISRMCELLVKETGILLLPSELFGFSGPFVRLGLGQANFSELLPLFESFLQKQICYKIQ
jgi:aspartate/methionine/tyrosine aminotransferase